MAARPTWKGYLKISLVNIPVKVFPATDSGATLSFNQLHAECQTRIQQKRWCPQCQKEVPNTDIVKGFEFEKGATSSSATRTSTRCVWTRRA
jgi:DNA end-binding protein Ku